MDWGWLVIGLLALLMGGVCWALVVASAGDRETAERAYRRAHEQLEAWEAEIATRQRARSAQRGSDPWQDDDAA